MKRRELLKGAAATAVLGFPTILRAQQYKAEYKMSTVVPPRSPGARAARSSPTS